MFRCLGTSGTCWTGIAYAIGWWFFASALLFLTWNKVVASLASVKQAKFWQALLVVATLVAFCAPRCLMKKARCDGSSFKNYHHGMPQEIPDEEPGFPDSPEESEAK